MDRRRLLGLIAAATLAAPVRPARAATDPQGVIALWYRLVLQLVRHTPTLSPPVASRAFAYLGIAVYEATAACDAALTSLAGQLTDLSPLPKAAAGGHDAGIVLHATFTPMVRHLFGNTGPTGQRALAATERKLGDQMAAGLPADVIDRSRHLGAAIAAHVLAWAAADGGEVIENLGFPYSHAPATDPAAWVPTSRIALQQAPLLPDWGRNRTFAMPDGTSCTLPPPPAYSEDPSSAFHAEAMEVVTTTAALTDEQKLIARFWSDDPMLSPTPPGHWIAIALQVAADQGLDHVRTVDLLARIGIAMADSFIACWQAKYAYNLVRPVTYIHRVIDPAWEPLLITPPFPEYPSGHSTQSGAAAAVLTAVFGDDLAFTDTTHVREGLGERRYPNFWAAAEEAALSRLYGGIHFRAAIARGLDQGRCVAAHTAGLRTLA